MHPIKGVKTLNTRPSGGRCWKGVI